MTKFIKGLNLCEEFFNKVAKPILDEEFPLLRYSAALIGYGSDVIGFDTEISRDHMWGPRFNIYLEKNNFDQMSSKISEVFALKLPYEFRGYSTNFSEPDIKDNGVQRLEKVCAKKVNHLIEFHTLQGYFQSYLGYTPLSEIKTSDWLTFSEHRLLAVTSGKVFHDDLGLNIIREKLSYYSDDVWLYLLASKWMMIAEEEAFVGRCGDVGDEIGSRIITSRIINHLMRLCFLMERKYAPYSKWFGSAFKRLNISNELLPVLERTLLAENWKERQEQLCNAYTIVAEKHNIMGITSPIDISIKDYFGRPYFVIFAERFANEISKCINSDLLREFDKIGSITHLTDVCGINDNLQMCKKLKVLFR